MYSWSRDGGEPSRPRSGACDRRCDGIHRISLRWRRFRESPIGPLRLLQPFHKQKRRQSAPLLQRPSATSIRVGPRLLLIAVTRAVAVASHHPIDRAAEGVAPVPVLPSGAVTQDAPDHEQAPQALEQTINTPA